MSYKRLRSHIKTSQKNKADQVFSAFEAEGQASLNSFIPVINHPSSDYEQKIEEIHKIDTKLGITFKRLNQHQRHAVFHPTQNAILSAMVGSGKTTVLIAKLFYLHFVKKVPFSDMVVLTFTNKAAREIKERIMAFLGEVDETTNAHLRFFGTFHAVARQLLQEHPNLDEIGFKPGFMIMDETEKQDFLERIIAQENLNIKYQNHITKRWRKFNDTGEIIMGNMKSDDDFKRLIQFAEAEKRSINTMDFDDLISLCNQLIEKHKHTSQKWIIVDEFQDCNAEQLQMIENLRTKETQLFVVGDQNQSIYGWRGSKEHLFQEIQANWQASWMELPQNYRSTENILSVAEALLQQNSGNLIATRQSGSPISIIRHFDDQQEAYYLKEQILLAQKENKTLDNMAILFRTHQQIKIVETIFKQANIPFQQVKRNALHEDPALAFLLQVFKLCINHNDIDTCLALICNKTFGALKRSTRLILMLQKRNPIVSALQAAIAYLETQKKQSRIHIKLLKQIELFKTDFLQKANTSTNQFIDFLNLIPILKPTSIHHANYINSINDAWEQLSLFIQKNHNNKASSALHHAIDQVVLEGSFQINDRIKEQGHGVHLLTIHASKGLEFDHVYIAGANTGIIPLVQHQKGKENLKEEKRLLFVAITRAKNKVEIGWHAQPTIHNAEPEPSYFLNAIPESLLSRKSSAEPIMDNASDEIMEEWIIGLKVKHKKYGDGEIIRIDEKELACIFPSSGEKAFSKAFAKALLVKIH